MIGSSLPILGKAAATIGLGSVTFLSPLAHAHSGPVVHSHTHKAHTTALPSSGPVAHPGKHFRRIAHAVVQRHSTPVYTGQNIIGDPSEVSHWTVEAMRLTGVRGSNWYSGLRIIEQGESDDNQLVGPWQAGYDCDINCQNGTPSEGIVQTIQATMNEYHQPGTSHNMLNPVADISASINYIQSKYGGISNVPGVQSVRSGGSYVGY